MKSLALLGAVASSILLTSCKESTIESVEISRFKGGALGAYSIIHDDLCSPSSAGILEYADTIASNRGVRFGAGAIVSLCLASGDSLWPRISEMVGRGHELISHSWEHGASVDLGWLPESWSYEIDVVKSREVLEREVPGAEVRYFIFPYDAYSDERKVELARAGYLAARVGERMYEDRGINLPEELDRYEPFLHGKFDAYMSRREQREIDDSDNPYKTSIYNDENDDVELQHLRQAIARGAWVIQEFHDVADGPSDSWGPITVRKYRQLMDSVQRQVVLGDLWNPTPTEAVRYFATRVATDINLSQDIIELSVDSDFDENYASKITLSIRYRGELPSAFRQNGEELPFLVRKKGEIVLDVDPRNGDVKIER